MKVGYIIIGLVCVIYLNIVDSKEVTPASKQITVTLDSDIKLQWSISSDITITAISIYFNTTAVANKIISGTGDGVFMLNAGRKRFGDRISAEMNNNEVVVKIQNAKLNETNSVFIIDVLEFISAADNKRFRGKISLTVQVREHVLADLVVLKDTKGNDKVTNFWSEANGRCTPSSWTFLNSYYATCYSGLDNNLSQSCTLKTLSYDVADANLVYINIQSETRSCKSQLTTNPKCQETFNAYAEIKNNEAEDGNSKFIGEISLLRVPLTERFNNKNETYLVKTDGFKLISFSFLSEYYCGSITTFNVFYYKCQGLSNSLIDFTSVAAPAEGTKQFPGKCTSNAVPVDSIPVSLNCKFDGTSVVAGSCICSPGHTKEGNKCTPCKTTEFKAAAGNEECSKCGNFSTGVLTFCACHQGYNRAADEKDDSSKPCHSSPPFTGKMPSPTSEESTLLVMIILSVLLVIFGVAFFAVLYFFVV